MVSKEEKKVWLVSEDGQCWLAVALAEKGRPCSPGSCTGGEDASSHVWTAESLPLSLLGEQGARDRSRWRGEPGLGFLGS